ncbi:sugar transferase [Paraflavitalea pollutisoli]|uniref:sugar transferase n=1 Tax=Paraflavitalea pollutisoli TaxID=3034143 RepID=UPI0023ED9558|nr:sugar transferase [Paraflavitalea sp. H1-2-19X]
MDVLIGSSPVIDIAAPHTQVCYRPMVAGKPGFFMLKRCFDIGLALLVLLLLLSWMTPLLSLLLYADSKGPVFFLQRRVGRGGRSFLCYKFRTMVVNRAADYQAACPGDKRITRVGAWLRNWHIDELPQFVNVLLGDMSVVGPRPHMYSDCRRFALLIPGYKLRNLVRPGITGLAQVKGFHGPVTDRRHAVLRYQWDLYYLRNASSRLDFMILIKTLIGGID